MKRRQLLEFISRLGMALHSYGASSQHVETALKRIAKKFTRDGEFFVTPTFIMSSINYDGEWLTRIRRVQPGGIDLGKLSQVDQVGDEILTDGIEVEAALEKIEAIDRSPVSFIQSLILGLAFMVASASFSLFLLGTWRDCMFTALSSFVAWIVVFFIGKFGGDDLPLEFFIAFLVSLSATIADRHVPNLHAEIIILSSLIVLVPGLSITLALFEIATKNWIAGTARLTGGFAQLMRITFGVVFGTLTAGYFFGPRIEPVLAGLAPSPLLPESLLLVLLSLSICVSFRSQWRDIPWALLGAVLAFYVVKSGETVFAGGISFFGGGLILAMISNAYARIAKRPALNILLPGLIPMVPGSIGYKSLTYVFNQDVMGAMTATFSMMVIAVSLVAGMTLGNLVVHPRRSI